MRQADDLLVVAPRWAEPMARRELSDQYMPLADLARPDADRYRTAIELSILGQRAPELAGWRELGRERVGKFELRRLENPRPLPVTFDFVDALRPEQVSVQMVGPGRTPCPWAAQAPVLARGRGGHPTFPARRFACPLGELFNVGVTVIADQNFLPRRCIWAHPPAWGELLIRYRNVDLGVSKPNLVPISSRRGKRLPALGEPQPSGFTDLALAALIATAYIVLLIHTVGSLGYTRDEGSYFQAVRFYQGWFEQLWYSPAIALRNVDSAWRVNNEHPSLVKSLFALSNLFLQKRWHLFAMEGTSFRFPGMVLSGLGIGLVYLWGWLAALAGGLGLELGFAAAVLVAPVVETLHVHPWGLSSYSPLVGGAAGGATLGLNRGFWGYSTGAVTGYLNATAKRNARVYLHDTSPFLDKWREFLAHHLPQGRIAWPMGAKRWIPLCLSRRREVNRGKGDHS